MPHFVLVHGSFHGAWCWSRFAPLLEQRGHKVATPNFPASGGDPAPITNATLVTYVKRVADVVAQQPEPVVLVGHSMGAIVSAQVAEQVPDRIRAFVSVCGLLLRSGESLLSFLDAHKHLDVEDLVLKNMSVSADGTVATFPVEAAPDVFYNACAPDDAKWAASQLRPQATAVYGEPLRLTDSRFGRVRRFYVEARNDRAVSIRYQRVMVERTPCEKVFSLDSDHSPFLSQPDKLAAILETVATETLP